MTLSLAAVFIPVLFMGGVLGRLFREFSVTICVAILISGVVSVTLTPMLCSRFLKKPHGSTASSGRGSARSPSAASTAARAATTARCRSSCGTARATMAAFVVGAGAHRRAVRPRAEGLHPGAGHRPDCGHDRSGAGHGVRQAGRVPGQGRRHHPRRIRTSTASSRRSAAARRRRSAARTSARSSCT